MFAYKLSGCGFESRYSHLSIYILSKILFPKRGGLPDSRVASVIKKEDGFVVHFL